MSPSEGPLAIILRPEAEGAREFLGGQRTDGGLMAVDSATWMSKIRPLVRRLLNEKTTYGRSF
jgi:hypothetical protein